MPDYGKKVIKAKFNELGFENVSIHSIKQDYEGLIKIDVTLDGVRQIKSLSYYELFIKACQILPNIKSTELNQLN